MYRRADPAAFLPEDAYGPRLIHVVKNITFARVETSLNLEARCYLFSISYRVVRKGVFAVLLKRPPDGPLAYP